MDDNNSSSAQFGVDSENFISLWKSLKQPEKRTFLLGMLEGGLVKKLQELALNGENLTIVDEDGSTLLHHAAMGGDPSVVDCLMYLGCNPNTQDSRGFTALHVAAEVGAIDVIRKLIANNASLTKRDKFNKTFIGVAKDGYMIIIIYVAIISYVKKLLHRFISKSVR